MLIFGGKNVNGFQVDEGYTFQEDGENNNVLLNCYFGSVSPAGQEKRSVFSSAGKFNSTNCLVNNNMIYFLRIGMIFINNF